MNPRRLAPARGIVRREPRPDEPVRRAYPDVDLTGNDALRLEARGAHRPDGPLEVAGPREAQRHRRRQDHAGQLEPGRHLGAAKQVHQAQGRVQIVRAPLVEHAAWGETGAAVQVRRHAVVHMPKKRERVSPAGRHKRVERRFVRAVELEIIRRGRTVRGDPVHEGRGAHGVRRGASRGQAGAGGARGRTRGEGHERHGRVESVRLQKRAQGANALTEGAPGPLALGSREDRRAGGTQSIAGAEVPGLHRRGELPSCLGVGEERVIEAGLAAVFGQVVEELGLGCVRTLGCGRTRRWGHGRETRGSLGEGRGLRSVLPEPPRMGSTRLLDRAVVPSDQGLGVGVRERRRRGGERWRR